MITFPWNATLTVGLGLAVCLLAGCSSSAPPDPRLDEFLTRLEAMEKREAEGPAKPDKQVLPDVPQRSERSPRTPAAKPAEQRRNEPVIALPLRQADQPWAVIQRVQFDASGLAAYLRPTTDGRYDPSLQAMVKWQASDQPPLAGRYDPGLNGYVQEFTAIRDSGGFFQNCVNANLRDIAGVTIHKATSETFLDYPDDERIRLEPPAFRAGEIVRLIIAPGLPAHVRNRVSSIQIRLD